MRTRVLYVLVTLALLGSCGYEADLRQARMNLEAHTVPPDRISYDWVELHSCYREMGRAVFTWRSYRNLLAELSNERYVVVPLREFAAAKALHPDKVVVGLRHDMDGNFCKAPAMAAVEARQGFRSSFYVRHTDPYYAYGWPSPQRRRVILPYLRAMQEQGHEIGLHFDVVTLAAAYGLDGAAVLDTELAWLRGEGGLDVTGVAHHGSTLAADVPFQNYEFFAGMTTRESFTYRGREVALGRHRLEEFGLDYEAYHLDYDFYFSDVGGSWTPANPLNGLPTLSPGQSAVILTHPVWWGSDDDPFKYE